MTEKEIERKTRRKKKVIAIAVAIILGVCSIRFVQCYGISSNSAMDLDDYSTAVKANKKKKSEDMFEKIGGYLYTRIVYDKQTGVEYAMSWGCYNEGTLTMLVNADGTPKIYDGFKK